MKVAIIGTGIAGNAAAWKIAPHHDITVFEKGSYVGGHSNTVEANIGGKTIPVDTGFIVFNKRNYINMVPAFDELKVPYEKSDMSFAFSINEGKFEYSAAKLFAQKSNYFNWRYWRMLLEVLSFNKKSLEILETQSQVTLGEFLDSLKASQDFRDWFILPMGSAIWSCPTEQMLKFPALAFIRFFHNHGLLTVNDQPQWYTVSGGSREYVKIISAGYKDKIRLNSPVQSIKREADGVVVNGEKFDAAVVAVHGYHALELLENPTIEERNILSKFRYQFNKVFLHQDERLMPKRKDAWSAWNYLVNEQGQTCCTYWMNQLQNIPEEYPLFVTTNPYFTPAKVIKEIDYEHPIFDSGAISAQSDLPTIQGADKIWYCGAYFKYGFHEDGFTAGINAAEDFFKEGEVMFALAKAKVWHKRLKPKVNEFNYKVFYLCFSLKEIPNLPKALKLNKRGALSFYDKDHGSRDGKPLQAWIDNILSTYKIDADDVILLTYPRVFGYVFNPVSFWYCMKNGELIAVLAEVNNTFGESHNYLVCHADKRPIQPDEKFYANKNFHVSPFCKVEGKYIFSFGLSNEKGFAIISHDDVDGRLLETSVRFKLEPLTKKSLFNELKRSPLMTLLVIGLIHWQALKLFTKRVKYNVKPQKKDIELTLTDNNEAPKNS